ncbi:hypothetical protein E2C01_080015 [Portunus trituberculatus]|uniref:Uncharacterized protein n=1 Tax=Portunus trituberculatus TaxID=210409 RepID=A0A5B7IL21_PORTR|nr:hypothetical protein [Portunus trituberculatus]
MRVREYVETPRGQCEAELSEGRGTWTWPLGRVGRGSGKLVVRGRGVRVWCAFRQVKEGRSHLYMAFPAKHTTYSATPG